MSGRHYSKAERQEIIDLRYDGLSTKEIAEKLNIPLRSVQQITRGVEPRKGDDFSIQVPTYSVGNITLRRLSIQDRVKVVGEKVEEPVE